MLFLKIWESGVCFGHEKEMQILLSWQQLILVRLRQSRAEIGTDNFLCCLAPAISDETKNSVTSMCITLWVQNIDTEKSLISCAYRASYSSEIFRVTSALTTLYGEVVKVGVGYCGTWPRL